MAVCERVEGGRAALQCDLLMMVLPGAYLLLANNTAVDLSDAPCYLDLEYQYPYHISVDSVAFTPLFLFHTLCPEVVLCSITFW